MLRMGLVMHLCFVLCTINTGVLLNFDDLHQSRSSYTNKLGVYIINVLVCISTDQSACQVVTNYIGTTSFIWCMGTL